MKKIFINLLLIISVIMSMFTVSAFNDVNDGYEHKYAISTLTQLGVINGYEDGTFRPEDTVERDEMAKLVFVLYTTMNDAGNGAVKFDDVTADNWAAGYISWCAAKSIVGGYSDGTFRPDGEITYDEALKMTCAMLGYTDFNSELWPVDVRQKALTELNLGENIEAEGSDKLTRGQVAQLLYNALDTAMNETYNKIYHEQYEQIDKDGKITGYITVPVQVKIAKTLAKDTWGFEEIKTTVNSIADDKINGELTLAELGLEHYEDNTDALIGLDISYLKRGDEILANAAVLGYRSQVKIENVYDIEDTDKIDTNYVIINGEKYKSENITINCDITKLVKPNIAIGVDKDGDGKFETITVGFLSLMDVTKVNEKKDGKETYLEYTVSGTKYTSDQIAGAAINEKDVIVATTINDTLYVDAIVKPVVANASKIGEDTIILDTLGEVKYNVENGIDNATIVATSDVLFAVNADKERIAREFYIYNNTIVRHNAVEETLPDVKIGVFFGIVDTKETVIDNKIEKTYIGKLFADGKVIEVNVVDYKNYTLDSLMIKDNNNDTYIDNYYNLVNYVVDKNGNYHLYDTVNKDKVSIITGSMSVNKHTGLITIGDNTKIETVKDTVMFYTYAEDTGFVNLGTYTDNIPAMFETKDNVIAYVVENEDGYFTLLATKFENELVIPKAEQNKTYLNDGRLIVYAYAAPAKVFKDEAYFEYYFVDCATLEKFTIISETSIADGASVIEAGKFYGYDVNDGYVSADASTMLKTGIIDSVLEKYEVIKIGDIEDKIDDAIIWAINENNEFVKLTLDKLETGLNAIYGTYTDDNNDEHIAWIYITNYVFED